jgi:hypothetical protein
MEGLCKTRQLPFLHMKQQRKRQCLQSLSKESGSRSFSRIRRQLEAASIMTEGDLRVLPALVVNAERVAILLVVGVLGFVVHDFGLVEQFAVKT